MTSMRTAIRLAATILLGNFAVAAVTVAEAQDRVRWKMHSAFPSGMAILGSGGKRASDKIDSASHGNFQMRFYEPGALVPGLQYFDPVAQGSIDVAWGAAGYGSAKDTSLSFFTAVPFGMGAGEYLAWMRFGDGHRLWMEVYNRIGLAGVVCGMLPPEASGWFRKEIKSTDDLKGLKMRFFGIGARVMEKFGVSTQLLAGGDIYPALELGTIDASEVSVPSLDESLGIYQVAKHYYFPGWHQPASLLDLAINKEKYDGLSEGNRNLLASVCGENIVHTFAEGEALQPPAMARMQAKGVTIHLWPQEMLDQFRAAWEEVVAEESERNPNFRKVWENFHAFRTQYAIWQRHGYLK